MRKRRFRSPRRRKFESDKKWPGNKPKNKTIFNAFWTPKTTWTRHEITPESTKILLFATSCPCCCSHGPPRWSPGAKMASQGDPETPKWLPKVLPRESPAPPNAWTGGLHFMDYTWGLKSRATNLTTHLTGSLQLEGTSGNQFWITQPTHWTWAYMSTLWGCTVSGNRFWISQPTH